MNCNCYLTVNEKLAPKNLMLAPYPLVMPNFEARVHLPLEWVDDAKAPKGKRTRPPQIATPFCPFCGAEAQGKEPESEWGDVPLP